MTELDPHRHRNCGSSDIRVNQCSIKTEQLTTEEVNFRPTRTFFPYFGVKLTFCFSSSLLVRILCPPLAPYVVNKMIFLLSSVIVLTG